MFFFLCVDSLFRMDGLGLYVLGYLVWVTGLFVYGCFWVLMDEPESLILAQSERWRHA